MRRRGDSKATSASVTEQKTLLMRSFPGESDLRDDDADLSPQLEMKKQRHEVMGVDEVNDMAYDLVMEHLEGMPRPQIDGSLSREMSPWTTSEKMSLPLLPLGCPARRALRHAPREGAWGQDAMEKARLEFLVSGTIVAFVPEVRPYRWTACWLKQQQQQQYVHSCNTYARARV